MKEYICLALAVLAVPASAFSRESVRPPSGRDQRGDRGRQERSPRWPEEQEEQAKRSIVFNVFCRFYKEHARGNKPICYAGARFNKAVGAHGGEVFDDSAYPESPQFEVECEGSTIHNSAGQRYTDRVGTRIQAETGPYPAIVLPSGALRDRRQRVDSELELRDATYSGDCFLYTET